MLSREDAGGEYSLFPEGPGCPPGESGMGQGAEDLGCGSLAWLWDAAGEDVGAGLSWEQGAVLHCHPEPRLSESVFLLFQLKRK